VQAAAGILCHVKPGDAVVSGAPLLELHTDTPDAVDGALDALAGAWEITDAAPQARPLVIETIRG
jgi:thymidine phosphorylase